MYLDPGRVEWEVHWGFGGKRYLMVNAMYISLRNANVVDYLSTPWFNYGNFCLFLCWLICYSELNLGVFTSCPQNSSPCDECEKKRTMLGHGLSETTFSSKLWHGVLGRVVDEVWKQLCPSMHEPCPRPLCTGKGVRSFSIQLTPSLHQMCVHCFFAPVLQRVTFWFRNNVVLHGRSTKVSKTSTDQHLSSSSAPLVVNNNVFLGLWLCELFNYSGTSLVSSCPALWCT